jgi:hypothetical protein
MSVLLRGMGWRRLLRPEQVMLHQLERRMLQIDRKNPQKNLQRGGMIEVVMDADIRNKNEDFILEYKRDQSIWEKRPA